MENNTENTENITMEFKEHNASNMFVQNEPQTKKLTWNFEGREYPLLLVNRTGGTGLTIISPTDKKTPIGILKAYFAWQSSEPFFEKLDIETIDKASNHDDWTERENENIILKNAKLFSEIVVGGESIDLDETTGEQKEPVKKSREQMLGFRKVVQSDLISLYSRDFHIERWLPEGMNKLDALLSNPTELFFTVKIGDYNNPNHLLMLECDVPTDDAIADYKSSTFHQSQNNEGDWRYTRNNEKRYRFAKKYIRSVQGAMLGKPEELEFDDSDLHVIDKNDDKQIKEFKNYLNPEWIIKIGEAVASCFDLGKK